MPEHSISNRMGRRAFLSISAVAAWQNLGFAASRKKSSKSKKAVKAPATKRSAKSVKSVAPAKEEAEDTNETGEKNVSNSKELPADASISLFCMEAESSHILFEQNATAQRPPASIVKLMQMLLVAEGLASGKWTLEQPITISAKSQGMGGTQVLLAANETWPLGHLMLGVAVASANDAAMAVAEGLWGGEEEYLKAMNARAQELGMRDTEYHSVHGLPPDKGELPDRTTARDMAILARACVGYQQIMEWTSTKEFQFRPKGTVHYNTNKLLWRMKDCDGLKTGFIRAAGFCVVATAQRDGVRLVGVVLGSPSKYGRFNLAENMMETAFSKLAELKSTNATLDAYPVLEGGKPGGWRLEVRDGVAKWKGLPKPEAG